MSQCVLDVSQEGPHVFRKSMHTQVSPFAENVSDSGILGFQKNEMPQAVCK